ncbi:MULTISPECIES: TraC family protein [unclassified Aureimonas]|uniref:TraC family protein n=1 Tax=unclassified Aureimonas TaxID=2615206 RepID=UPI0009ECBDFE|nr:MULTISPECIES: TraC family protein [unclassified Aureimonas]
MDKRSVRRRFSVCEIDAEIERLRERRRQVVLKENERFARAAIKAGLAELDIPDDALDTAFAEMAARFRKDGAKAPTASGDTA